ncbi:MAG: hypothetical protein ABI609_06925 [Acidobacteriota bacterium]
MRDVEPLTGDPLEDAVEARAGQAGRERWEQELGRGDSHVQ